MGFFHAVDWSERWIVGIWCFHAVLFLSVILTRRHNGWQFFFLCLIFGIVRLSETINTYCAANWRAFSKQNYFDSQGVFMSSVVSAPLLCMAGFMAINGVYQCGGLLVTVKQNQLKKEYR